MLSDRYQHFAVESLLTSKMVEEGLFAHALRIGNVGQAGSVETTAGKKRLCATQ